MALAPAPEIGASRATDAKTRHVKDTADCALRARRSNKWLNIVIRLCYLPEIAASKRNCIALSCCLRLQCAYVPGDGWSSPGIGNADASSVAETRLRDRAVATGRVSALCDWHGRHPPPGCAVTPRSARQHER